MTEIFNARQNNQPPIRLSLEELKLAIAEREDLERGKQYRKEALDQLLGQNQTLGYIPNNLIPTQPNYSPTSPMESHVHVPRPEVQPVIRRDMTVDGVPRHLSADMDNSAREAYIASKEAKGSVVDYDYVHPNEDHTTFNGGHQQELNARLQQEEKGKLPAQTLPKVNSFVTYPKNHPNNQYLKSQNKNQDVSDTVKQEKAKKIVLTKRAKRIGAAVLAGTVFVGGGTFAAINLMGGSHEEAIVDDKNVTPVDPELIPALTAAPLVEAFGGCMDEKGGGSVLDRGSVKSEVTTSWMMGMKGANGGELRAEFGEGAIVYPKVQLESDIDYTACVVAANVADVVSVDITNPENPVANVNLEKVDPQLRGMIDEDITKIKRGWSSTDFEPKLIKVQDLMQSGVEQKTIPADVATNFTAAYNDVPNATVEVQSAEKITVDTIAAEGSAYSEQLKTVIKQKIATSIKTKVEQLAKDNLTTAKQITVNFTGKLKTLLAKNSPAPKADRFTIPTPKAVIKDFAPIAPSAVEQAK